MFRGEVIGLIWITILPGICQYKSAPPCWYFYYQLLLSNCGNTALLGPKQCLKSRKQKIQLTLVMPLLTIIQDSFSFCRLS